ncbi:alpha/beta hydrolase [Candidatus Dependentiae bacterium]
MSNKKIAILFLSFIFLTSFLTHCTGQKETENKKKEPYDWHFDTSILRNSALTKQNLMQARPDGDGFQEVTFENEDRARLTGLLLERENARATIIFSHGFCPGGKEIFAPFVKIAPQDCNLLFVDQKGYGQSPGPGVLSRMKQYGRDNYKDITGAIDFMKNRNNLPNIVFGWCSGAFNATTAVLKSQEEKKINERNIKGLIFDSGFSSILDVADIPMNHIKKNYVPSFFTKFYSGTKKEKFRKARRSYICKFATLIATSFLRVLELFIRPPVVRRNPQTILTDKVRSLRTPVLVIHSEDDKLSRWENVRSMVDNIPNKKRWIIEQGRSSHANHHLKLKEEYKTEMRNWIGDVLRENT